MLNKVLSIYGHILLDFMQIFQDRALPNLEYQFLQVIWCASAFSSLSYCDKCFLKWKGAYYSRYLAYSDTTIWISWKYSKMGHFPTSNITYFKSFGLVQL